MMRNHTVTLETALLGHYPSMFVGCV